MPASMRLHIGPVAQKGWGEEIGSLVGGAVGGFVLVAAVCGTPQSCSKSQIGRAVPDSPRGHLVAREAGPKGPFPATNDVATVASG